MIFTSIWAYAITIGVLVVFHEFGHYLVARLCGIKVLRFSVGFGKILYARRFGKGETEWAFSAIPLGGYVKMLDEREGDVPAHELSRAFNRKPAWQRMAVVVAGPLFNLLLAVILFCALFMYGIPDLKPELGAVPADTPAARAQMQAHETVLRIDGEPMLGWNEMRWRLLVLSLRHAPVEIVGRTADGAERHHMLDLAGIQPSDLGGPFLQKLGLQPDLPILPAVIGKLMPASAAEQAGLHPGDRVLRVDGQDIATFDQWRDVVSSHPGQRLHMELERDGKPISLDITPREAVVIGELAPGSAAAQAGLRPGDRVLRVNGQDVTTFEQWKGAVSSHPDQPLHIELERDGTPVALDVTLHNEGVNSKVIGLVGAYSSANSRALDAVMTEVRYGPAGALRQALQRTWDISSVSIEMLGRMVLGQASVKSLSGPINTAKYAGESVSLGMMPFIFFLAAISVGVGVLNLLPIPILDGGHLLYYTAEFLTGRPVPESAWETGQKIGAVVLIALMILVFYNDISRLLAGG